MLMLSVLNMKFIVWIRSVLINWIPRKSLWWSTNSNYFITGIIVNEIELYLNTALIWPHLAHFAPSVLESMINMSSATYRTQV